MKAGIEKMANEGVWKKMAHKYWVTQEKVYPKKSAHRDGYHKP
jgi:hypothetical protein